MNTFLVRLLTGMGCLIPVFLFLVVFLYLGGAAIAGAIAGAQNPDNAYEAGQVAGEAFGRNYGLLVFLLSLVISALVAFGLAFSGLFPWCRAKVAEEPEEGFHIDPRRQ